MRFVLVFLASLLLSQDSLRSQKHFLWKVEDGKGASAYLLGSLHVLTADAYPLPAAIDKAFAESKTLVEEVDLDEMNDPMQMMAADRKSTRLNSSHSQISYAVFCLK